MNNEEMTKGILDIVEDIVLNTDTTSQTEAQRKLFIILISYVMSTYWSEAYQQKLINHYHADMIEWLCGKFKDKNELMEVVNMFKPLTYADDNGLMQDKRVIKCVDDLIYTLPDIYDEWVRRNNKMKHDDDDVYTDSSNSENH